MPRRYKVTFEQISCSAAQDLIQVTGAAGKMLRIVKQWASAATTDSSAPSSQQLSVRGRFLPATVGNGTGGASVTPQTLDAGDSAASFTALRNSTGKATTSGTAKIVEENGFFILTGYENSVDTYVGPSEAYVFELLTAPLSAVALSGGVEVEEMGG